VAVFVALAGTRIDASTKAFFAWFGPKGVATMTFSLLVLTALGNAGRPLFDIAALAVFVSIVAHGLTDHAGAEWIARRAERREARADGERQPAAAAAGPGGRSSGG
jgi:NhaP-type Na+/H+ or K+/H+ antiporter